MPAYGPVVTTSGLGAVGAALGATGLVQAPQGSALVPAYSLSVSTNPAGYVAGALTGIPPGVVQITETGYLAFLGHEYINIQHGEIYAMVWAGDYRSASNTFVRRMLLWSGYVGIGSRPTTKAIPLYAGTWLLLEAWQAGAAQGGSFMRGGTGSKAETSQILNFDVIETYTPIGGGDVFTERPGEGPGRKVEVDRSLVVPTSYPWLIAQVPIFTMVRLKQAWLEFDASSTVGTRNVVFRKYSSLANTEAESSGLAAVAGQAVVCMLVGPNGTGGIWGPVAIADAAPNMGWQGVVANMYPGEMFVVSDLNNIASTTDMVAMIASFEEWAGPWDLSGGP